MQNFGSPFQLWWKPLEELRWAELPARWNDWCPEDINYCSLLLVAFVHLNTIDIRMITLGKALPPIKPLRLDQRALATIQPMFFEVHCNHTMDQVKFSSQKNPLWSSSGGSSSPRWRCRWGWCTPVCKSVFWSKYKYFGENIRSKYK